MIPRGEESALRRTILSEATRLFALRGFSGTSMREITEACGCSKPALYYYFSSKEELFREVIAFHGERIQQLILATLGGSGSVRERLHRGLDAMIDYCMQEPTAMRLIQRFEIAPEDTAPEVGECASRQTHLGMLATLIAEGMESEELRPGLCPQTAALVLAGTMHLQFEQSIASGEWNRERMHLSTDLIFDGIAKYEEN